MPVAGGARQGETQTMRRSLQQHSRLAMGLLEGGFVSRADGVADHFDDQNGFSFGNADVGTTLF